MNYYQYELGRSSPPTYKLRRICKILRVSADYILCLVESPVEVVEETRLEGV